MIQSDPRTILVIDDSPPTCLFLQRMLEKKGYRVVVAHDGDTGTKTAMEILPDLILLDKELPGMHGFDVSRILRRYQKTCYIPILMISSRYEPEDRIRGREMGADDFVSKNVPAGELDSKIRAFLRIKDLQDDLRRERDKLDRIFRLFHEPVVIVDDRDRIALASRVFLNLFRLPREVTRFQTFGQILDAVGLGPDIVAWLREGSGEERRVVMRRGEGEVILTARAAPIQLTGEDAALAVVFHDITEDVADERVKADFHSMIAHDLRSPLTVIQGYVALMAAGKTGEVNELQQEFLDSMNRRIEEITTLLNDFLDLNKIDAGFVNLRRQTVALAEIVTEVVDDLQPLARDRDLRITVTEAEPGLQVDADPLRLKQVLVNLLSNAIKYNIDGGWIDVALDVGKDDSVQIGVADGGVGMGDDELVGLFAPFQRGRRVGRVKGIGLGLAIVRKLVEAHGGAITVVSAPNRGSTFTFTLPRTGADALATTARSGERASAAPSPRT